MAVGAPGTAGGWAGPHPVKQRLERVPAGRDQQWLLSLLPAFPLLLLVLRLWYLSRQDLQTMLLLVRYVSPLGLLSALLFTLVWALPLVILLARAFGALLWASAPTRIEALRSWVVRLSVRMPDWVVALAVLLAALTWQLRFLPALLMLTLAIAGLVTRDRRLGSRRLVRAVCVVLPLVVAAAAYAWLLPAVVAAVRAGEAVTAVLLAAPPAVAVLLTGPVPARAARFVTHWAALALVVLGPFVFGAIFLRAPILPTVALEVAESAAGAAAGPDGSGAPAVPAASAAPGAPDVGGARGVSGARGGEPGGQSSVVLAHVIAVDDRMTTLLDTGGRVLFVPNERILSQTLCQGSEDVPASVVAVRGWPVEQAALEWLAPPRPVLTPDPRCQGRPLHHR